MLLIFFSDQLIFVWLGIRNYVPCVLVSACNQMITHRKKQQQNKEICVISLKTLNLFLRRVTRLLRCWEGKRIFELKRIFVVLNVA